MVTAATATEVPDAASAQPEAPTGPDPEVAAAFALGWQVATVYRDPHRRKPKQGGLPADLPGVGSLSHSERTSLAIDQIDAGLARLGPRIEAVGLTKPTTEGLRKAFESGSEDRPTDIREPLLALHVEVLATLTAADFRLGKAYGLGRALADTTRVGDAASLAKAFGHWRIRDLRARLSELDSALPRYSSEAARRSMSAWERWVNDAGGKNINWERDGREINICLRKQGRDWRALLSGEKGGTDTLAPNHYLEAAAELLGRVRTLAGQVVRRFGGILIAIGLVIIALVAVLVSSDRAATEIAALGGIAASLGITWKGIGSAVGRAADRVQEPLWGAALTTAIAAAITDLPTIKPSPASEEYLPPAETKPAHRR